MSIERIRSKIVVFAIGMMCVLAMTTPARAFDSGSFGDTLADLWDKAKETGADVVDTVKENGPGWVETAKDTASTALDKGKEIVSDTQDKVSTWNQQQQDEFWAREERLLNGGAQTTKPPVGTPVDSTETPDGEQIPIEAPDEGQAPSSTEEPDPGQFQTTLPDGLDQLTDRDSASNGTVSDSLLERLETGFYEVDDIYYYFDAEAETWSQVTFEDPANPTETAVGADSPATDGGTVTSIDDTTKADGDNTVEVVQQPLPEETDKKSLGEWVMYGIIAVAVVVIAVGWIAFVVHQINKEKDEEFDGI